MRIIKTTEGQDLAIVLDTTDYLQHSKKLFFSDPEDALQVGSLFFPPGSTVAAHRHKGKQSPGKAMEVILMLCGSGTADIYGDEAQLVESVGLRTGDILIQKCGGHGFSWHSGAVVLEIKLGPYYGRESDKEPI